MSGFCFSPNALLWARAGAELRADAIALPMNLILGARHLCRFNFRCRTDFGRRSGLNAARRFRGSKREDFVRRILTLALLAALNWAARAEPPYPLADSGYLLRAWGTEDGLPENSATAIAQTQDG